MVAMDAVGVRDRPRGKRVLTDFEAEAQAFFLHLVGPEVPPSIRQHLWQTWLDLNVRSYFQNGVDRSEAEGRLHRLFQRYRTGDEDLAVPPTEES